MTEITKTTIKRWDAEGKLIEHTETTVEKSTIKDKIEKIKDFELPELPAMPLVPNVVSLYACNPVVPNVIYNNNPGITCDSSEI